MADDHQKEPDIIGTEPFAETPDFSFFLDHITVPTAVTKSSRDEYIPLKDTQMWVIRCVPKKTIGYFHTGYFERGRAEEVTARMINTGFEQVTFQVNFNRDNPCSVR